MGAPAAEERDGAVRAERDRDEVRPVLPGAREVDARRDRHVGAGREGGDEAVRGALHRGDVQHDRGRVGGNAGRARDLDGEGRARVDEAERGTVRIAGVDESGRLDANERGLGAGRLTWPGSRTGVDRGLGELEGTHLARITLRAAHAGQVDLADAQLGRHDAERGCARLGHDVDVRVGRRQAHVGDDVGRVGDAGEDRDEIELVPRCRERRNAAVGVRGRVEDRSGHRQRGGRVVLGVVVVVNDLVRVRDHGRPLDRQRGGLDQRLVVVLGGLLIDDERVAKDDVRSREQLGVRDPGENRPLDGDRRVVTIGDDHRVGISCHPDDPAVNDRHVELGVNDVAVVTAPRAARTVGLHPLHRDGVGFCNDTDARHLDVAERQVTVDHVDAVDVIIEGVLDHQVVHGRTAVEDADHGPAVARVGDVCASPHHREVVGDRSQLGQRDVTRVDDVLGPGKQLDRGGAVLRPGQHEGLAQRQPIVGEVEAVVRDVGEVVAAGRADHLGAGDADAVDEAARSCDVVEEFQRSIAGAVDHVGEREVRSESPGDGTAGTGNASRCVVVEPQQIVVLTGSGAAAESGHVGSVQQSLASEVTAHQQAQIRGRRVTDVERDVDVEPEAVRLDREVESVVGGGRDRMIRGGQLFELPDLELRWIGGVGRGARGQAEADGAQTGRRQAGDGARWVHCVGPSFVHARTRARRVEGARSGLAL